MVALERWMLKCPKSFVILLSRIAAVSRQIDTPDFNLLRMLYFVSGPRPALRSENFTYFERTRV